MENFSCFFSKWFYRGEGNKTLVISNPESRKVLRLRKSQVKIGDTGAENPSQEDAKYEAELAEIRQEFERNIHLCKQIFIPLLGEKYVKPELMVELPDWFMGKVKDLVTSSNRERPGFRLKKEVNEGNKIGMLMPDYCFVVESKVRSGQEQQRATSSTFCIELKPKCGTMPVCNDVDDSLYKKVKESICKYCLFQYTKRKNGMYEQKSEYCPLDLFSSDVTRVWHALICLLKNPQNNLRIFEDGNLIYLGKTKESWHGDEQLSNGSLTHKTLSNESEHALQYLEHTLKHSFDGNDAAQSSGEHAEINGTSLVTTTMFLATVLQLLVHDSNEMHNQHVSFQQPVCSASLYNKTKFMTSIPNSLSSKGLAFSQGGVLRKILNIQKLDEIGTDKAFCIFNDLHASGLKDLIDPHIFTLEENIATSEVNEPPTCDTTKDNNLLLKSQLDDITKFLIAASANDCSIMISFHEVFDDTPQNPNFFQDVLTGRMYKYSIGIVDLDRKGSERIPKYYQEYLTIVDDYLCFNQI